MACNRLSLALPLIRVGLRQSHMRQHAVDKLARDLLGRDRAEIKRWDDRKDGRSRFRGERHVAQVDKVERRFAHAQDQRPLLLQTDIGGALDELDRHSIGDARQCSYAARQHDHGVGLVGTTGHVGPDIRIVLLADFLRSSPQQLVDQLVAAGYLKLFGHNSQAAVGENKIDRCDALVAVKRVQQVLGKDGAAGAGNGDGQGSRCCMDRRVHLSFTSYHSVVARFAQPGHNVLATRVSPEQFRAVKRKFRKATFHELARAITLMQDETLYGKGTIVVVSAGTSDIPVAEEAVVTVQAMGNEVQHVYDVGVAGIHRLLARREALTQARVVIVCAGMEGALPSVVGGLVGVPVIAVPTSVGYGASYRGIAALLGMLNSCASNVSVVNIDNGFGAGYVASIINRLE